MEFLKSAVASAISKGPPFPYSFGERVDCDNSIWTLNNGTKREDGSDCSIFSYDLSANKSRAPLAKNALRKLRTLRHPGVIRILDTVETETYIYVATERVTPLSWSAKRKSLNTETIKWGLYNTAKTLKFINEDASSVHGNVRVSSIFTTESGEWKLSGFEVLSSVKDEDPVIYKFGGLLPDSSRYASPEIVRGGWDALKEQSLPATDAYLFGVLIYEVFNGGYMSADQLTSTKLIPPNMVPAYKRLLQANPKIRLSIAHFLTQGTRSGGFFDTPLIHVAEFVENMGAKGETEREEFLLLLEETGDQFPEDFYKMKVLPELLKVVEFGGGGPKVFAVVLKIGESLTSEEWEAKIVPVIVRLFSIPDRAIRVFLLDNLPKMIEHIPNNIVNNKIFPDMMSGFSDVSPIVREQSVKAVLVIINKLSDRTINGDLLKYLAKTQNDEQPGIRTNTTICLGKIAKNLGPNTRQKVLTAAFSRSLRDPFVHARNAALMALSATVDFFDENDCAQRILPAICLSLVDKEKVIRVQAQKTLDIFLQRVKTLTANMPDTVLPPPTPSDPTLSATGAAGVPRVGTPQTDGTWAGWAISSFTKKLSTAVGELETASSPSSTAGTSSTLAPPSGPARTSSDPIKSSANRTISPSPLRKVPIPKNLPPAPPPTKSFLDDDDNEENDPDAWGDLDEDNFFDAPQKASPPPPPPPPTTRMQQNSIDDDDLTSLILDKTKKSHTNPLPKGLSKAAPPTASSSSNRVLMNARIGVSGAKQGQQGMSVAGMKPIGAFKSAGGSSSSTNSAATAAAAAKKPLLQQQQQKKKEVPVVGGGKKTSSTTSKAAAAAADTAAGEWGEDGGWGDAGDGW